MNLKISGLVETYLTDKNGVKRKVGEQHNTISSQLYAKLANYMTSHATNDLIELSNMFTGGTGYTWQQEHGDGIAAIVYGQGLLMAAFASVASQPAANQFRVTGTWTNPEAGTINLRNATIGNDWFKNQGWEAPDDGG